MKMKPYGLLLALAAITCTHGPGGAGDSTEVVDSTQAPSAANVNANVPTNVGRIDAQPSLYALDPELTDDRGSLRTLPDFGGNPLIISMFYGTCPYACPMLISNIGRLLKSLEPGARRHTRVLLVSLDPDRDTHEKLAKLKRDHGLDERWVLARAPADDVRELAAVLGIKYRRLEGGGFNHSTVITVLDQRGRARGRLDGLEQPLDEMVRVLNALAADSGSPRSIQPDPSKPFL